MALRAEKRTSRRTSPPGTASRSPSGPRSSSPATSPRRSLPPPTGVPPQGLSLTGGGCLLRGWLQPRPRNHSSARAWGGGRPFSVRSKAGWFLLGSAFEKLCDLCVSPPPNRGEWVSVPPPPWGFKRSISVPKSDRSRDRRPGEWGFLVLHPALRRCSTRWYAARACTSARTKQSLRWRFYSHFLGDFPWTVGTRTIPLPGAASRNGQSVFGHQKSLA